MYTKIRAFTLIELLVVIAIIALLSGVVIASLGVARMKSRDAKRISDLNEIKMGLELYYDANGYYPGNYKVTAKCISPPCWDNNGYTRSNEATWEQLAADLDPYIKLPKDPINYPVACAPWRDDCHYYVYGNVSRAGVNPFNGQKTTKDVYDLAAVLEDPNHPQICKYQKWTFGSGFGTTTFPWCIAGGGVNTNQIYDPSPN